MIQLSPQASSIPFLICFSVRHIVTSVTLNAGCSRHILTLRGRLRFWIFDFVLPDL